MVRDEAQAKVESPLHDRARDRACRCSALLWLGPISATGTRSSRCSLSFAGLAGGGGWGYAPRAKAIKETKRGINSAIAESLGLTYETDSSRATASSSPGATRWCRATTARASRTCGAATLGGRAFTLHEAHLEEQRGSGKNRR